MKRRGGKFLKNTCEGKKRKKGRGTEVNSFRGGGKKAQKAKKGGKNARKNNGLIHGRWRVTWTHLILGNKGGNV